MPVRLHKYLASCGVGSRRACEVFMEQGRVTVDGAIIREPGFQIEPGQAQVCFNGQPVRAERAVYLMLNKPPGIVCTSRDPQGRPRAIDLVPKDQGRLYTVGRLDADSEGLLLLTNDGEFANRLTHPRHHVVKAYELWLKEPLPDEACADWRRGIADRGEMLRVLDLRKCEDSKAGVGYLVKLGEGRNRHIRRMAESSGKKVLRLRRVAIGPLKLGSLKRGAWRMLTAAEVNMLVRDR